MSTCRNPACDRDPEGWRDHVRPLRAGYCRSCYSRWRAAGFPATGPPARPRRTHAHTPAAGRIEDYEWLRTEQRLSRRAAAARIGVTLRTVTRYDQRLRAAS